MIKGGINMKKTFFNVKIATIVQFILCLIFAFAIWLSVKYADVYSENKGDATDVQTEQTAMEINFIEV